jgi:hypothetical protein
VGLSYRVCFEIMVHSGNLRTIYPYRNNLNYPLPAFLASKSLYMHMEHKISSRHPVKNTSGVLKEQRVFAKGCKGIQGH